MTATARAEWGVVVPVKRLEVAKSRLGGFGVEGRRRLALAFAQDVVRAVLACPAVRRVVVVTDDEQATVALAALGAEVRPDRPDAGLNPALEHGAALLREDDGWLGVATVAADLPVLRPADVAAALAATTGRAFVADATGLGTTLLAARAPAVLSPAFGTGSAARHRASGAREIAGSTGLRRDVDTPDDLAEALALGVGPSTAAALANLDPAVLAHLGHAALAVARSPGQGTMRG